MFRSLSEKRQASKPHDARYRRARVEPLEDRRLLSHLNPHGMFPGETFEVGDRPNSVAVGDLNGDGHTDLVTANARSDNVSVLLGRGDGTFDDQATYPVEGYPQCVALGDLNGDGHIDIVTANESVHFGGVVGRGDDKS